MADFTGTKFSGMSVFIGAKIRKNIEFLSTEFDFDSNYAVGMVVGGNLLVQSNFRGHADFSRLDVKGTTSFSGSKFAKIPNFSNAKFARPPEVAGIVVPLPETKKEKWWQFKRAVNSEDVVKLRKLKSMALDASDHEKDGEFFAKEMVAKRGVETNSFSGLLFNTLYWKLSDFGQDFIRPLKAMFVSFLVFMVVHYSIVYCWVETTTKTTSWNQLAFALEMSIRNVIPVLGGLFGALPRPTDHPSSFMKTYHDLVLNGVDADWLVIIGIVQNIIGAVLLFLFLLALRNKFRLK